MQVLLENFNYITWQMLVMWAVGGTLIYLAIAKQMEPTLLLPMGFGAILVNLPVAIPGTGVQHVLDTLFTIGIDGAELFPLMLFIGIASPMKAADFLQLDTLIIIGLGLVAFVFDTFGGIMVAKLMNLFSKEKINPMIGAAGISAFPMSARVVHKLGLEEDNQNFLLMHSIGVNVSGQIASVVAGGLILALVKAAIGG